MGNSKGGARFLEVVCIVQEIGVGKLKLFYGIGCSPRFVAVVLSWQDRLARGRVSKTYIVPPTAWASIDGNNQGAFRVFVRGQCNRARRS